MHAREHVLPIAHIAFHDSDVLDGIKPATKAMNIELTILRWQPRNTGVVNQALLLLCLHVSDQVGY